MRGRAVSALRLARPAIIMAAVPHSIPVTMPTRQDGTGAMAITAVRYGIDTITAIATDSSPQHKPEGEAPAWGLSFCFAVLDPKSAQPVRPLSAFIIVGGRPVLKHLNWGAESLTRRGDTPVGAQPRRSHMGKL